MKAKEIKPRHSFAQRKPYLDNRFLFVPQYYENHCDFHMPPFDDVQLFGNVVPVHIEFCSGNGEWIIQAAKSSNEIGWIAVEMKFSRARKIYAKAQTLGLKNLIVVWGRGEDFVDHYLKKESIDKAFVHFPDPWPKQRHAKHRMIQKGFCSKLKNILRKEGQIHLITDDLDYRDQMIDVVNIDFKSLDNDLFVIYNDEFDSYFCRLWRSLDRTIYCLNYKKRSQEQLIVDVSHDGVLDCEALSCCARNIVNGGKKIVWIFDFNLQAHELCFFNPTLFSSYRLTFETLKERVLDEFASDTAELRLFDSNLDLKKIKSFSPSEQIEFDKYIIDFPALFSKYPAQLTYHFFLNAFVDFLECLASYLPLDPMRSIHLKLMTHLKRAEYVDLFSLLNFRDLDLKVEGAVIPSQRLLTTQVFSGYQNALVIPSLEKIDYLELEKYIQDLQSEGVEFCLVPEQCLIEAWHGLERLYVIEHTLTDIGHRALEGFRASMGQIHKV